MWAGPKYSKTNEKAPMINIRSDDRIVGLVFIFVPG